MNWLKQLFKKKPQFYFFSTIAFNVKENNLIVIAIRPEHEISEAYVTDTAGNTYVRIANQKNFQFWYSISGADEKNNKISVGSLKYPNNRIDFGFVVFEKASDFNYNYSSLINILQTNKQNG